MTVFFEAIASFCLVYGFVDYCLSRDESRVAMIMGLGVGAHLIAGYIRGGRPDFLYLREFYFIPHHKLMIAAAILAVASKII